MIKEINQLNGLVQRNIMGTKLYGRDDEIQKISRLFAEVEIGHSRILMINGESGSGKSVLVHQSINNLLDENHFFCYGKYDEHRVKEPFSAFKSAFNHIIKEILMESPTILERTKTNCCKILSDNGAFLSKFLPELQHIVGKQIVEEEQEFFKNQSIFFQELVKFVKILLMKRRTLTFFLDDLQWADQNSLELLDYLIEHVEDDHLLLIGAYRSEEVREDHPLMKVLTEEVILHHNIAYMNIRNLSLVDSTDYISELISCGENDLKPLASLIYANTLGNPYYVQRFIQLCLSKGLIKHDSIADKCAIDISGIKGLSTFESVVALILSELKTFEPSTLMVLKVAQCIGTTFDVEVLLRYFTHYGYDVESQDAGEMLQSTLSFLEEKGLVYRSHSHNDSFHFAHDKVMDAINSIIKLEEGYRIHHRIGIIMLKLYDSVYISSHILRIMSHLIKGMAFFELSAEIENESLAGFFLQAADTAFINAAYYDCEQYSQNGIDLLGDSIFRDYYDLAYGLFFRRAQCLYLLGYNKEAEALFETLLNNTKTNTEKADVYIQKVLLYTNDGLHNEAIDEGLKGVNLLGFKVSRKLITLSLISEVVKSLFYFSDKRMNQFLEAPEVQDENLRKAIEVFMIISSAANIIDDPVFPVAILKGSNISAKFGNSKYAVISYAGYSIVLTTVLSNYKKSNKLEDITMKLVHRYKDKGINSSALLGLAGFVSHFTRHADTCVNHLQKVVKEGAEVGEYTFVGYCMTFEIVARFVIGRPLEEVQETIESYQKLKLSFVVKMTQVALNTYADICHYYQHSDGESGFYHADIYELLNPKDLPDKMTYYYFMIQRDYLFGRYDDALNLLEKQFKNLHIIKGYLVSIEYYFYYGLVLAASYDTMSFSKKRASLRKLRSLIKKMKSFAGHCSENFEHKYQLMLAEYYRITDKQMKAIDCYELAIREAKVNRYTQNEAIANELTAKFFYEMDKATIGDTYMNQAYDSYCSWGAMSKCKTLVKQYPCLSHKHQQLDNLTDEKPQKMDLVAQKNREVLFLSRFMEQSKDSETYKIINDKLMEDTQSVVGHVISEINSQLILRASSDQFAMDRDVETYVKLPKSVVRYVSRTNEMVHLEPSKPNRLYEKDPYINGEITSPILCMPLLYKGIFLGIVYLERPPGHKAFTDVEIDNLKSLLDIIAGGIQLTLYSREKTQELPEDIPELTDRESDVLQLMAEGMSNKEISETLNISVSTTKTHLLNVFGKFEVNNRIKAVIKAQKYGILKEN